MVTCPAKPVAMLTKSRGPRCYYHIRKRNFCILAIINEKKRPKRRGVQILPTEPQEKPPNIVEKPRPWQPWTKLQPQGRGRHIHFLVARLQHKSSAALEIQAAVHWLLRMVVYYWRQRGAWQNSSNGSFVGQSI